MSVNFLDMLSASVPGSRKTSGAERSSSAPASEGVGDFRQSMAQESRKWERDSTAARTERLEPAPRPQEPAAAGREAGAADKAPEKDAPVEASARSDQSTDASADRTESGESQKSTVTKTETDTSTDTDTATNTVSEEGDANPLELLASPLSVLAQPQTATGTSLAATAPPGTEGAVLSQLASFTNGMQTRSATGATGTALTELVGEGEAPDLFAEFDLMLNQPKKATVSADALNLHKTVTTPELAPVGLNLTSALQSRFKSLKMDAALPGLNLTPQVDSATVLRPEATLGIQPMSGLSTVMGAEAAAGRLQVPVTVSFGQPQWAGAVAERSAWLFSQNIESAELQLDPPEMGRVNVQIQIHHNDQASVSFTSANPNVRDALDQSAQRLRDMLAEQGVELVNVDVSDQQTAQQQDSDTAEGAAGPLVDAEHEADIPTAAPATTIQVNWGVDQYV